jgi:hypothetical protein
MRYRLLAIVPPAGLLAVLVFAPAFPPSERAWFFLVAAVAARSLAAAGCFTAASRFAPGDHLRRGWVFFGIGFALLVLRDLVAGPNLRGLAPQPAVRSPVLGAFVLGANLAGVVAAWSMARAWFGSGLAFAVPRRRQVLLYGLTLAVALLVAGPAALVAARDALAARPGAASALFSSLGDLVVLSLLAPILLMALSLRGGVLAWTWGLLTAATATWILMDLVATLGPRLGLAPAGARLLEDAFRVAAALGYLGASVAQVWALRPRGRGA